MIKVKGLQKYFFRHKRNEIHVLNDMTIDFPESGLVVLLGPSGSGKTTLLNVIGGLDSVQQGTIEFDDQQINRYKSSTWDKIRNESVGYIFQNYNLLPQLSVYENIALVLKMLGIHDTNIIDQRVTYILKAVNMYPFRKKKSTQLSGGQQQRVAIARALVKNPRVIIADEPTGNLDSKNSIDIMNIIKEISKQKLVVLVTHERDLANVYGDRIIEIKDGKIIDDHLNESDHEHHVSEENILYLKDMNQLTELGNDNVKLSLYHDSNQSIDPVNIRLIVKNKTLYLDVDSSLTKIRLIDESSNLLVKDEHYVKKNKEQLLETAFKTDMLDNKDVHKSFRTIVSIKQIFMLALQKILYSSRKGKIMLFSFIMSGAVIALSIAMVSATIIPDLSNMRYESNYVRVRDSSFNKMEYEDLVAYADNNSKLYVNTLGDIEVSVLDPLNDDRALFELSYTQGFFSPSISNLTLDIVDHVQRSKIVKGRLPQSHDEFIITSELADQAIQSQGAEYGVWTWDHLLLENFEISGYPVKLVGITKSDLNIVYTTREFANMIKPTSYVTAVPIYAGTLNAQIIGDHYLDENLLVQGQLPTGSEVLVSQALYDALLKFPSGQDWPKTFDDFDYTISGVFTDTERLIVGSNLIVEKARFDKTTNFYVYSSQPRDLVNALEADDIEAILELDEQTNIFNQSTVQARVTTTIVALVIIGFTLLGFYFIMHSSMVSRIYEISVYRALGMKKSEIFISFMIEILILSTVTSLIGYGIATLGLVQSSNTLIGAFRAFLVTPLTIFVGIIILYGINLIGGMFPIFMLLRKTPAQILAQYDI
ncbi:MAG: ABC transporter ATP-binding protein/permease [Tenericutes bacterium]|nr:ABC transporter ATP-binding protein/permease [Mycoplasmatota bacterium]